jgi:hypothetical protein
VKDKTAICGGGLHRCAFEADIAATITCTAPDLGACGVGIAKDEDDEHR